MSFLLSPKCALTPDSTSSLDSSPQSATKALKSMAIDKAQKPLKLEELRKLRDATKAEPKLTERDD